MFYALLYSGEVFQQKPREKLQYAAEAHLTASCPMELEPCDFFSNAPCTSEMSNVLRDKRQLQLLTMVCGLLL